MTAHMPHPPRPEPERLALAAGCASLQWLPAGTTLVVLDGRPTLLHPPLLLAEQTLRPRQPLNAGHALVLDRSGWWALEADTTGSAHVQVVLPAVAAWRARWPALFQWLFGWTVPRQTSRG